MKRHVYYYGTPGKKYGMYNTVAKKFQFGICEDSPMLAVARLHKLIGDNAKKWRFEPRILPDDVAERLKNFPAPGWMPLETALPPKQTRVLCYMRFEPLSEDVIMENYHYSGGHWLSNGDCVTHWMPLPPLPEGGSSV